MSFYRIQEDAVEIDVQVIPRASRTRVVGRQGDRLKVQLSAPPVDGAANQALIELLSETLGVRRGAVSIQSGETSKKKRVRIEGSGAADAVERLAASLESAS